MFPSAAGVNNYGNDNVGVGNMGSRNVGFSLVGVNPAAEDLASFGHGELGESMSLGCMQVGDDLHSMTLRTTNGTLLLGGDSGVGPFPTIPPQPPCDVTSPPPPPPKECPVCPPPSPQPPRPPSPPACPAPVPCPPPKASRAKVSI